MLNAQRLIEVLESNAYDFYKVVPFNRSKDKIVAVDLSKTNPDFTEAVYGDEEKLTAFIDNKLKNGGAKYLIGGYKENRQMYRRSQLFDKNLTEKNLPDDEEPRSMHLGTDIWGNVDTEITAPLGGMVHSFAYNNHYGDYGATIILQHQLDSVNFYTLYGHLALKNLAQMRTGKFITRGERFANFGPPSENGNWPPHLHFQLIMDMGMFEGDYPGVCKLSEAEKFLKNSPNPDLVLKLMQFVHP